MSKIIEALEKAKRDGHLDQMVESIDERSTVLTLEECRPIGPKPSLVDVRREGLGSVEIDPKDVLHLDSHLVPLHQPMSVIAEQYRAFRKMVERAGAAGKAQVLAVTSSVKGEGKSLSVTNLALVLAQDTSKRVLLVDADLRRPRIHELLGLPFSPGLTDILQGRDENTTIQSTALFGLEVVTAGEAIGHPGELLASSEFSAFLQRQRNNFDHVVIDTPPLLPISDVGFLAESVDGVLLVVRANKTAKSLIQQAVDSLPEGKLLGTILNRSDQAGTAYGYKHYGSYGGGY